MKTYIKPTIDFIKLTVEERFAAGSGSTCTLTGGCGYTDSNGVDHEFTYYIGLNG